MEPKPFTYSCALCGATFQFGPRVYDGRHIARYNMTVCRGCYQANWDGWAPVLEEMFESHLRKHGIPLPERNEKGWYPRD